MITQGPRGRMTSGLYQQPEAAIPNQTAEQHISAHDASTNRTSLLRSSFRPVFSPAAERWLHLISFAWSDRNKCKTENTWSAADGEALLYAKPAGLRHSSKDLALFRVFLDSIFAPFAFSGARLEADAGQNKFPPLQPSNLIWIITD